MAEFHRHPDGELYPNALADLPAARAARGAG